MPHFSDFAPYFSIMFISLKFGLATVDAVSSSFVDKISYFSIYFGIK